jgi:hypothetical protein
VVIAREVSMGSAVRSQDNAKQRLLSVLRIARRKTWLAPTVSLQGVQQCRSLIEGWRFAS